MIKKIFYTGVAEIITVASGLVASITLTRVLGPDRWGKYSQVSWLIGLSATFLGFGLSYVSVRYLAVQSGAQDGSEAKAFVVWITIVQFASVVAGGALLIVFAPRLIAMVNWHLDLRLVRIAATGIVSLAMLQLARSMLRGFQEFRTLSVLAALSGGSTLLAVLITLIYPSVKTLVLVVSVGQLALLPWAFSKVWQRIRTMSRHGADDSRWWRLPRLWRSAMKYAGIVFLTTLLDQIVWQRSEIFFLAQLADARESGYYGLAYTISTVAIGTVATALTGTLTPVFSSLTSSGGSSSVAQSYRESINLLSLLLLPAAAGLFVIAPDLILLLYGEEYVAASAALRVLVISTAVRICARPSASVVHALNKPGVLLMTDLIAVPVDLALAWQLVPVWQAQGAAIANLAAHLVGGGALIGYATIAAGLSYDFKSIGKAAFSASVCAAVACLVSSLSPGSALGVTSAIVLGGTAYVLILMCMGNHPTRQAVAWIWQQVRQRVSAVGR